MRNVTIKNGTPQKINQKIQIVEVGVGLLLLIFLLITMSNLPYYGILTIGGIVTVIAILVAIIFKPFIDGEFNPSMYTNQRLR